MGSWGNAYRHCKIFIPVNYAGIMLKVFFKGSEFLDVTVDSALIVFERRIPEHESKGSGVAMHRKQHKRFRTSISSVPA